MPRAIDSLIHALDLNPEIGAEGRILFLRAEMHPALEHFRTRLTCQQTWKPRVAQLEAADFRVEREESGSYPLVLVLPDPQRDLAAADLARGYDRLAEGGILLVAQHNDSGAKKTEQHLREAAGEVQSLSKHHCRMFWATKSAESPWNEAVLQSWRERGAMRRVMDGKWWSKPGLFSWDRVDEGSALLVEHLPTNLSGHAADLGCGWGFLSAHLLRQCPEILSIDLYDADADAFEPIRRNLGVIPTRVKTRPLWRDVTAGIESRRYDVVVTNPPFHDGKTTDPTIGLRFLGAAAAGLKPEGHLWLVANRQLPYERALGELFAETRLVEERNGFKVLHAHGPKVAAHVERRGKSEKKRR
ncbi:MAG: methyltransferase [Verrucomicrobiaceae bacterium]|nr:methyltransferase [Verrucomicrobiaceae bacterium]